MARGKKNKDFKQDLRTSISDLANANVDEKKKADILKRIEFSTTSSVRASLADWQLAYDDARDNDIQDRTGLIEIYETIEIDSHVSAVTETITNSITQRKFNIVSGDKIDEEKTKLFQQSWFDDFLSIVLDTTYWGYSSIQLGDVENNKFKSVKSIPRQNIIPEKNSFKPDSLNDKTIVDLNKEPYKTWVVSLFPQLTGDQYKLGKYNKVAKMFILKREVTSFWGIYNELFGNPYRVMKTNVRDDISRENAISAMEQMSAAAFSVIDTTDEVEFIDNGSNGNGFNTFHAFIDYANKEISKAILGSTMVLEDGSSRSQSEVHQANTNSFIESRAKWAVNVVNDELIPRMIKLGFPLSEGDRFEWKDIDKLTQKEWSEVFESLNAHYAVPVDVIRDKIGIEVEEKQFETESSEVTPSNETSANKIKNFYQKIFK